MEPPHLLRALRITGEAGFAGEADAGLPLCRAANRCARLVKSCGLLCFAHARDRLEFHIKAGSAGRVAWMLDHAGADVRVWAQRGPGRAPARWRLPLFDAPPAPGAWLFPLLREDWPAWPAPAAHGAARAALLARCGGGPHGGFACEGFGPLIEGPLGAWRGAHPGALAANVNYRDDLEDADFAHLAGVRALSMSFCDNPALTRAAFAHLRGVHTLWMSGCNQASLGDAAFAHCAACTR